MPLLWNTNEGLHHRYAHCGIPLVVFHNGPPMVESLGEILTCLWSYFIWILQWQYKIIILAIILNVWFSVTLDNTINRTYMLSNVSTINSLWWYYMKWGHVSTLTYLSPISCVFFLPLSIVNKHINCLNM